MDPPTDGDDVARVVPLRRRDGDLKVVPPVRDSLPRERAAFDPEIEPGDVILKRRLRRRLIAQLGELARPPLSPRLPRPAICLPGPRAAVLGAVLVLAGVAAVAVIEASQSTKSSPRAGGLAKGEHRAQVSKVQPKAVAKHVAETRPRSQKHHRPTVHRHTRTQASANHLATRSTSASESNARPAETTASTYSSGSGQSASTDTSSSPPHYTPAPTPTYTPSSRSGQAASGSRSTPAYGPSGALAPGSSPNG